MSNHFTGLSLGPPLGDQRLDLCDLYAFQSPTDPAGPCSFSMQIRTPTRSIPTPSTASISTTMEIASRHRDKLRVLKAARRPADRKRLRRKRRGGPFRRGRRNENHRRCRSLLRRQAEHRQVRRLQILRRRAQRCLLFRLRRYQKSVRYLGRQKFHRAAPWRQIAVDRRRFKYRSQCGLDGDRTADQRARRQCRDPHLGPMQRARERQADARRSRRPPVSVSSFFNTDDTKLEYNASEPVNDRKRWTDSSST